jgi:hypothetical protein
MSTVLYTLRQMLSLVGFSDATYRAGLHSHLITPENASYCSDQALSSTVDDRERKVIDLLIRLRSSVRTGVQGVWDDQYDCHDILSDCFFAADFLRDELLYLGIEVMDYDETSKWRYCTPRSSYGFKSNSSSSSKEIDEIPLHDFFYTGKYVNQFAEFDQEGIPTKKIDGTNVSSGLRKALLRKRARHLERLRNVQAF